MNGKYFKKVKQKAVESPLLWRNRRRKPQKSAILDRKIVKCIFILYVLSSRLDVFMKTILLKKR